MDKAHEKLPVMTSYDRYLWCKAAHHKAYIRMGAHLATYGGQSGVHFAVWAPNAERVSVICDLNKWTPDVNPLIFCDATGVWQGFIPGLKEGDCYKYAIKPHQDIILEKADPYAFATEPRREGTDWGKASVVWEVAKYQWHDSEWMAQRASNDIRRQPMNIYECNLGSWRRKNGVSYLNYEEVADYLVPYLKEMGYTHVEFMPLTEYPYDGSWGYQSTGYFAPSSRFGTPEQLMYLIDKLHCNGIGVILDWVPAHFPKDAFSLARFDGSCLYEHEDPRQGCHPEWNTYIFNYGRNEVRNFLISSGLFWLECYHVDGIRVDAVASMLYLDYGKQGEGNWIPNKYGGHENLEAVSFLRDFNSAVAKECPGCFTCAEESTSWAHVTGPVDEGGLGFTFKWNMGWMHDVLDFISQDPIYRKFKYDKLTFGMLYQYSEDFILPFSHDEVVYGKRSLLNKMPGDEWQSYANMRTLYGYMIGYPGKKLNFMGNEFAQWNEWNFNQSLDWHLLNEKPHKQMQEWCAAVNRFYKEHPELWELDDSQGGFTWLQCNDPANSVAVFVRYPLGRGSIVMVACNFTPVPRRGYRIGLPIEVEGSLRLELNSDDSRYGGSGYEVCSELNSQPVPFGSHQLSLELTLAPLSCMFYTAQVRRDNDGIAADDSENSKEEAAPVISVDSSFIENDEKASDDDRAKVIFNHELK
ncbi:MAG: 1,4-alpha-glucan branching protein GlgB [Candidatus Bruticola sp.]